MRIFYLALCFSGNAETFNRCSHARRHCFQLMMRWEMHFFVLIPWYFEVDLIWYKHIRLEDNADVHETRNSILSEEWDGTGSGAANKQHKHGNDHEQDIHMAYKHLSSNLLVWTTISQFQNPRVPWLRILHSFSLFYPNHATVMGPAGSIVTITHIFIPLFFFFPSSSTNIQQRWWFNEGEVASVLSVCTVQVLINCHALR